MYNILSLFIILFVFLSLLFLLVSFYYSKKKGNPNFVCSLIFVFLDFVCLGIQNWEWISKKRFRLRHGQEFLQARTPTWLILYLCLSCICKFKLLFFFFYYYSKCERSWIDTNFVIWVCSNLTRFWEVLSLIMYIWFL